MAPLQISRTSTAAGAYPEFVSATVLPGRGFQLLQITASIPGHGDIKLLHVPENLDLETALTGTGKDAHGALGATMGAALMAPWAGHLHGTRLPDGNVSVRWGDGRLNVPADPAGDGSTSVAGLMLDRGTTAVSSGLLSDGQSLHAVFHEVPFDGVWQSRVTVTTDVQLTGRVLDLILMAENAGEKPVPMGLGWRSLLNIASGNRQNASLTIPSRTLLTASGASGQEQNVDGTNLDFSSAEGVPLDGRSLDASYVNLQRAALADGPAFVLRDPGSDYGLSMTLLGEKTSQLDVEAHPGEPWVMFEAGTNRSGPFIHDDPALRMLQPGAKMVWHLRMRIFSVPHRGAAGTFAP